MPSDDPPAIGYPIGRKDLSGTLARVTYHEPGLPPDLLEPPSDPYEGRPFKQSTWRRHLATKRAGRASPPPAPPRGR